MEIHNIHQELVLLSASEFNIYRLKKPDTRCAQVNIAHFITHNFDPWNSAANDFHGQDRNIYIRMLLQ